MSISLVYSPGILAPVVMPIDSFFGAASSAVVSTWNITTTVKSQVSTSWKITQQQVSSQTTVAWNTRFRVKVVPFGNQAMLSTVVVHPITWHYVYSQVTWNTDSRSVGFSTQSAWKVFQRRSSTKKIAWNATTREFSFQTSSWRDLKRIYIPGVTANYYNGLVQPVVHPIDMANQTNIPTIAWNIESRINKPVVSRWNTLSSAVSRKTSLWNTLCNRVAAQVPSSWFTRSKVSKTAAISWSMQLRTYRRSAVKWNTNLSVISQKAVAFNVRELIRILKVAATNYMLPMPIVHPIDMYSSVATEFQWNVIKRVSTKSETRWNTYIRDPSLVTSTWNTMYRISIPSAYGIYYPGILQPTVHPITERTSIWGPRITWNTGIVFVTTSVSANWNTLLKVKTTQASGWASIQRVSSLAPVKWNTLMGVVSRDIIDWNVGKAVPNYIRQIAIPRQDFAY